MAQAGEEPSKDDQPEARDSKVAVLGLRGFPNVMGGVESHCAQLYPRLSKATRRRFLVLGRKSYMKERVVIDDGLEVRPVASVRNKYLESVLHTALGLAMVGLGEAPDIIHLHAIGPALFTPFAKLLGKKVVVTHHGEDFQRPKWNGFAKAVLRLGEWIAVRFADRVIVVSRSVSEGLKRKYPRRAERIVHIPNGATRLPMTDPDPEATLRGFGLKRDKYVLSVGRLEPSKGFHDLVAAFGASPDGMKLVIAGGADHADAYSRELVAEAGENVVFTGVLPPETLQTLYANASLFVLASSHEGLPIVVLEAIVAGAPVLLSDIQPNLDLDLPGLHYFPVGDVDALAQKLDAPHGAFRVSRNDIVDAYDWDRIAEQTEQVYADVLAQQGA